MTGVRNHLLFIFFVSFIGCGTPVRQEAVEASSQKETSTPRYRGSESIKEKLYSQYQQWKGVRYRYGGLNKKGVDCSGFVYLTFKSKLGIELPRSTKAQSKSGRPVAKDQLKTGDLVFFNTKVATKHVGIYLEKGRFLHASTSKGVMISRMDNVYWRSKYWRARRIDEL